STAAWRNGVSAHVNALEEARRRPDLNDAVAARTPERVSLEPVSFRLYGEDFAAFAEALGRSFARYGFAVIGDHGLDQARIDAAIADAKAFFALPEDLKLRYKIPGVSGQRGYTPFGVETAKGAAHF